MITVTRGTGSIQIDVPAGKKIVIQKLWVEGGSKFSFNIPDINWKNVMKMDIDIDGVFTKTEYSKDGKIEITNGSKSWREYKITLSLGTTSEPFNASSFYSNFGTQSIDISFGELPISPVNENEFIVKYRVSQNGIFSLRPNVLLPIQKFILPLYSLDGVNFITMVPDSDGEQLLTLNIGDEVIIKSHPSSLYQLCGSNRLKFIQSPSVFDGESSSTSFRSSTSWKTNTQKGRVRMPNSFLNNLLTPESSIVSWDKFLTSSSSTSQGGGPSSTSQGGGQSSTWYEIYARKNPVVRRFNNGIDKITIISYGGTISLSYHFAGYIDLTEFEISTQVGVSYIVDFSYAWKNCSSLTSFPQLDVSQGTDFRYAWNKCSSLTSFPQLDVSQGTDFRYAWNKCSSLTSFPVLDVSQGTNFYYAWYGCHSLTSFPLLDVSSATSFRFTWGRCTSLTSFPQLDVSSGTNFYYAWYYCTSLTSFPQLDVSQGTDFRFTWGRCSSLTSFPQLDVSSGTNFRYAWYYCTSLPHCPGGNEITIPSGATTTNMCSGII